MINDFLIAAIGGLIGTSLMTGMMLFGKRLGLPAIDAQGILGYMIYADRSSPVGYIMHLILGAVFAIGYALVFRAVPGHLLLLGAGLGIIHWLLVGWMFAFAPLAHAGMKAGTVKETGAYMLKSLGMIGFIAGMVGHIVFGVAVALTYAWLGGSVTIA